MEIEKRSIKSLKTVREKITKARWPIEDFASDARYKKWGFSSDDFKSLKPEVGCAFGIDFEQKKSADGEKFIEIVGYCLSFISSREFGKFDCKLWLENETGEKCCEKTCK
jgi:hypothetical protein